MFCKELQSYPHSQNLLATFFIRILQPWKRYSKSTRTIFASLTIVHSVIAILAGALYTGGLLFQDLFSSAGVTATASGQISTSLIWGILIIGISTGAYCIYGGLDSVVRTDVFQVIVLLTAGVLVTVVALDKAGGWEQLWLR